MKYFSALIKPASSYCNLKCTYCFYNDVSAHRDIPNYGMMTEDTCQQIIEKTVGYFEEEVQITFAFQGGEPTCVGLTFFEKFIQEVEKVKKDFHRIHYTIQTNGTNCNEEWVDFFKKHHFLVGVSLDGFQENHDAVRINKDGTGTYTKVMSFIELLRSKGVEFNVLTVLTPQLAKHPKEIYRFYQTHDMNHIQFIPCLAGLDDQSELSLKPEEFATFYIDVFELWFQELQKNHYRSISLFDNLIPMFAGRPPQQCGYLGFCTMQFVIEADGSVYPCDFYVLDQYKIGNINDQTIKQLATSNQVQKFIQEPRLKSQQCEDCPYIQLCYGNCKRLNNVLYNDTVCGLRMFMTEKEKQIKEVASLN